MDAARQTDIYWRLQLMDAARQTDLALPAAGKWEKCVDRTGARYLLDAAPYELDALLNRSPNHTLRLTGVLDIGSRGAEHTELRFIVACLLEFRAGKTVARTSEQLAVLLFGDLRRAQGLVSAKRVYRALNCKHDHFYSLADDLKLLALKSQRRPGPGGSAILPWSKLVDFIEARRLA